MVESKEAPDSPQAGRRGSEVVNQLLADFALGLLRARHGGVAAAIEDGIGRAARLVEADRGIVFTFAEDGSYADASYEWYAADERPARGARYQQAEVALSFAALRAGQTLILRGDPKASDFPDLRAVMAAQGTTATILVPIHEQGALTWIFCFEWRKTVPPLDAATVNFAQRLTNFVHQGLLRERELLAQAASEAQLLSRQKLESLGVMAGGIAHDFNNVLQAHLGLSEVLEGRLPQGEERELVRLIKSSAMRASELTRRLLIFSRADVRPRRNVSVAEGLDEIVQLLRRSIPENRELKLSIDPAVGTTYVVPTDFEQAIVNLCTNASAAMPEGGTIDIAAKLVVEDKPYVLISVRDNGRGMSPEELARAGQPFFTTKPAGEGTGLGLAMVERFAERAGGRLRLTSALGEGTLAELRLPSELGPERPKEEEEAAALTGTETVLVVEDDPIVRRVACSHLQRAGYTVLQAGDGRSALELYRSHPGPIALVLTDAIMPRMDGAALYAAIAAEGTPPPFLFASGYDAGMLSHQFLTSPGRDIVEKPYEASQLLSRVRRLIDAHGRE